MKKATSIVDLACQAINRYISRFIPYLSASIISSSSLGYVNAWTFLAVDMALINACLDSPNENTVLYFAASNKASINKAEHRRDNRVAKDTAVIKFAILLGSNVLVVVVMYVAGLYATTLEESSSAGVFCWVSGTTMKRK